MNTRELALKLEEAYADDRYHDQIMDMLIYQSCPEEGVNVGDFNIFYVDSDNYEHDNDDYVSKDIIFSAGEQLYSIQSITGSWSSYPLDFSTVKEVRKAQKLVDFYEEVK